VDVRDEALGFFEVAAAAADDVADETGDQNHHEYDKERTQAPAIGGLVLIDGGGARLLPDWPENHTKAAKSARAASNCTVSKIPSQT
jgi:hypothetical protein